MCPVTVNATTMLATSGSLDGAVRIWDPATGHQHATLEGHRDGITSVCPVTVNGTTMLATGGDGDGAVRIWDPATGQLRATLEGHMGPVGVVCPVTVNGTTMLATGGTDSTVRIWDPATGSHQPASLHGHQERGQGGVPGQRQRHHHARHRRRRRYGADLGSRHRSVARHPWKVTGAG